MLEEIKKTIDKVEYLLANHPESRDDSMVLCQLYWKKWDSVKTVNDIHRATPAEAITRSKRKIQSGGLYISKKAMAARQRKEKEVRMGINLI